MQTDRQTDILITILCSCSPAGGRTNKMSKCSCLRKAVNTGSWCLSAVHVEAKTRDWREHEPRCQGWSSKPLTESRSLAQSSGQRRTASPWWRCRAQLALTSAAWWQRTWRHRDWCWRHWCRWWRCWAGGECRRGRRWVVVVGRTTTASAETTKDTHCNDNGGLALNLLTYLLLCGLGDFTVWISLSLSLKTER